MTLKEKFGKLFMKSRCTIEFEQIADKFAIGFAEWVIYNYPNKGTNHEDKLLYSKKPSHLGWSIESLLEIYKKEQEL